MYLGIDLGTSNSAIVGNDGGTLRLFKTSDGRDVLPSVIYIDRRGNRFVGSKAYDQASLAPENVAQGFKRLMGTATPFHFQGSSVSMSPEEASAEVLRTLVTQATAEAGKVGVVGTVITVPAAFNQMQSEATLSAASSAGLHTVGLLQEPVAAALSSLEVATNKDGIFLVYDLGGGTFDVALVQSTRGAVNILAHEGVNMLGGRDFDRSIVNSVVRPWLLENYDLPDDFQKDPAFKRLIRLASMKAEEAKIDLSTREIAQIFVAEEEARVNDKAGEEIFIDISLSRTQLEELTQDRVDASIELCKKILKENGLSHDDVDRLVFIGGPSKMPSIRDRVPRELGIAADLRTDPMTAVARGAAIFAESRNWDSAGGSARKAARGSKKASGPVGVEYDFEARTTADEARIRVTVKTDHEKLRISATNEDMWQSGEAELGKSLTLKVPLSRKGPNRIQIEVTDETGAQLKEASADLVITKIDATAAGIPATQTIAIKTRSEAGHFARNELTPLFEKGTTLPTSGTKRFRASETLAPDASGFIDIEIFEKTLGVPEPELNLFVGSYRITSEMLVDDGASIRKGEEILVHWSVDDNMLLSCSIELPIHGVVLDTPKFYVPSLGHKNYEGETGLLLATAALSEAQRDLNGVVEALGSKAATEIASLRRRIERQLVELSKADDPDSFRAVEDEARHIRQDISRMKHDPANRKSVLAADIDSGTDIFAQLVENPDEETVSRIKQLVSTAEKALAENSLDTAERAVEDMKSLIGTTIRNEPAFIFAAFERAANERHLAIDPLLHDRIVHEGQQAAERGDLDALNGATFSLYKNRAESDGPTGDLASLAGLMAS
jgi:molecular chaperone DnaK